MGQAKQRGTFEERKAKAIAEKGSKFDRKIQQGKVRIRCSEGQYEAFKEIYGDDVLLIAV